MPSYEESIADKKLKYALLRQLASGNTSDSAKNMPRGGCSTDKDSPDFRTN
jgi:hypothetical protein